MFLCYFANRIVLARRWFIQNCRWVRWRFEFLEFLLNYCKSF
jgi:hypothetical protein